MIHTWGMQGFWLATFILLTAAPAQAGDKPASVTLRKGELLVRAARAENWTAINAGQTLQPGHTLLAVPGTSVTLKTSRLEIILVGGLPGLPGAPTLETSAVLATDEQADLSLNQVRGRLALVNTTKQPVPIKLQVQKQTFHIKLSGASGTGDRLLVECSQGWPAGVKLPLTADSLQPVVHLRLICWTGEAEVTRGAESHGLRKGTYLSWRHPPGVMELETYPDQPGDLLHPKLRPAQLAIAQAAQTLTREGCKNLKQVLTTGKTPARSAALLAAAATDQLDVMVAGLTDTSGAEVRSTAVTALRHWVGLAAEHPKRLRDFLLVRGYKPVPASTFLELLHTYSAEQLTRPELFEVLIDNLMNPLPELRTLAAAQLYHHVPAGRRIDYDPTASEVQRRPAQAAWRKLIPEGQLPPRQ